MRDNGFIEDWERHWRRDYDPTSKAERLLPILEKMQTERRLGNVVVDVGSGVHSVCEEIKKQDFKLLKVDIAGKGWEGASFNSFRERMDIERLAEPDRNTKEALVRIRRWLRDQNINTKSPIVDTAVFVDVLNYVDYQKVIEAILKYSKPTSRLFVYNMPYRGFSSLFSEHGLKSNRDFLNYLGNLGMQVEDLIIDDRKMNAVGNVGEKQDHGMMVCVARRIEQSTL